MFVFSLRGVDGEQLKFHSLHDVWCEIDALLKDDKLADVCCIELASGEIADAPYERDKQVPALIETKTGPTGFVATWVLLK